MAKGSNNNNKSSKGNSSKSSAKPKKAEKTSARKTQEAPTTPQADANYEPNSSSEDPYDHVINHLENDVQVNKAAPKLQIRDFIDDEAEESTKSKKAKPDTRTAPETPSKVLNKTWHPAEAALLKLLIVGSPPLGRNSSGILLLI
jgi:hypothetical protein